MNIPVAILGSHINQSDAALTRDASSLLSALLLAVGLLVRLNYARPNKVSAVSPSNSQNFNLECLHIHTSNQHGDRYQNSHCAL